MRGSTAARTYCYATRSCTADVAKRGSVLVLSHSLFDLSRTQWDDDGTDEGRWHVGNVFLSLEHAEQAREKIKEVLLNFHKDHASPRHGKAPDPCLCLLWGAAWSATMRGMYTIRRWCMILV